MAGTNDFQPVAAAAGANVLTQTEYLALAATLIANGFQSGIVPSNQMNKVLRQGSIMSAVIGQLIADATGQNATDDGTVATLEANLARVIRGSGVGYASDSGGANAYSIALTPAPLALVPGMQVAIDNIVESNTGASTLNVNGLGALPIELPGGAALPPGAMVAGAGAGFKLNHAGTAWFLIYSTGAPLYPFLTGNNAFTGANTVPNAAPGTQQILPILQAQNSFPTLAGTATAVDCNTLTAPGIYRAYALSANAPPSATAFNGTILVLRGAVGDDTATQLAVDDYSSPGEIYVRCVTGLTTTPVWTGWISFASLTSPSFTGSPTAPTPVSTDNSNLLATTSFVQSVASTKGPLPQVASGIGQWLNINAVSPYALPSGGTWAYYFAYFTSSGTIGSSAAGIAAGGTTIFNTSGNNAQGLAWRIA